MGFGVDDLERFFLLSQTAASQLAALGSCEGQRFSQEVTSPRPLPPTGASISPHHMGKKSICGSIFGVFLLKYCYTKWNATAISV